MAWNVDGEALTSAERCKIRTMVREVTFPMREPLVYLNQWGDNLEVRSECGKGDAFGGSGVISISGRNLLASMCAVRVLPIS